MVFLFLKLFAGDSAGRIIHGEAGLSDFTSFREMLSGASLEVPIVATWLFAGRKNGRPLSRPS
jgi:hypothetical protein